MSQPTRWLCLRSLSPSSHPPTIKVIERPWKGFATGLGTGIVAVLLCLGGFLLFNSHLKAFEQTAEWSPEMTELWKPFATPARPLILSIEDPLFVEVSSNPGIYYRDRTLRRQSSTGSHVARQIMTNSEKIGYKRQFRLAPTETVTAR